MCVVRRTVYHTPHNTTHILQYGIPYASQHTYCSMVYRTPHNTHTAVWYTLRLTTHILQYGIAYASQHTYCSTVYRTPHNTYCSMVYRTPHNTTQHTYCSTVYRTPHNRHTAVRYTVRLTTHILQYGIPYASQPTYFSFNSSKTPAGSNLGEHYQIL